MSTLLLVKAGPLKVVLLNTFGVVWKALVYAHNDQSEAEAKARGVGDENRSCILPVKDENRS